MLLVCLFFILYTTTHTNLFPSTGQRYDVIFEADQTVDNYWFRVASGGGKCDVNITKPDTQGSIFRYEGADQKKEPTSKSFTLGTGCTQETNIVPFVAIDVVAPADVKPTELDLTLDPNTGGAAVWRINGQSQHIDWTTPTLKYIQGGNYTLPANDNGIEINAPADSWVFWLVENKTPIPHPIHLHGHDFFVVAQGAGSGVGAKLNTANPIRRDTQSVDGQGFLVIAFRVDNPGAWLLHCHIAFHISGGLGVQFLERPREIVKSIGDLGGLNEGCKAWDAYEAASPGSKQPDSGL